MTSYITYVWTKTQSADGVQLSLHITGLDESIQGELRDKITTSFTPVQILSGN